jgi:hypothetical protein
MTTQTANINGLELWLTPLSYTCPEHVSIYLRA